MAIRIASIKFNNEFRSAQDLGYLLGCIGEKIKVSIEFYYENVFITDTDNGFTTMPDPSFVGSVANLQQVLLVNDLQWWSELAVGDTVKIAGTVSNNGTFTVSELPQSGVIRFNSAAFTNEDSYGGGGYVANITPFNGLKYAYNLISSGVNYNSLIDGEYQEAVIGSADATNTSPQILSFNGIKSYQIGQIILTGINNSNEQQRFLLEHNTFITPLFLANQYNDLLLGIKPDYYEAQNCLNYISNIQLGKSLTNPTSFKFINVPNLIGNTGWFNERFNGGINYYSVYSVVLTRLSDSAVITQLEYEAVQVDIIIENTHDSPFSNTNTKFVFGFNHLPEDESLYQNTGGDQTDNFVFDSKINTLGAGSVNGNNFGNSLQVIKTLTSTYISATQMKVTAVIEVGADAKALLTRGDFSRYAFWVITENHLLAADKSDKVNLLCQVNEFHVQLTTADLIDADIKLIQHPFLTKADGVGTGLELFPVDNIAVNTDFSIDYTGHTTEGIKINKIKSKLLLRKTGEADILLEDFTINTAGFPVIGGLAQNISFSQDRIFKIRQDVHRTITCERDFTADAGNVRNWVLNYPFMNRWEYWIPLLTLTGSIPSGIFDNTQQLNGINQFWNRLANVSGWQFLYENTFEIIQNGQTFEQKFTSELLSNDFNSNPDWSNETIKSYSTVTPFAELTFGGDEFITGYQDTKIVASFEKISGSLPAISDVEIFIWIETFEAGSISGIRLINSVYNVDSNSWFKSVDTSNKVKKTKVGAVYTGECLVDYSKIPTGTDFTIYARLYDKTKLGKNFEDGDIFEFEDSDIYEFEDLL